MRAMFSNDEAVSELIGVILALGIAVLALAVIQTTSVPVWDGALEQDHNLVIYNDFMQLRSNTFADSPSSAPIEMGFLYPNRILLRNPTRGVTGTIVTKNQTIRVQGIVSGGVEWAMNDSVEKLVPTSWDAYDDHANASATTGAELVYLFDGTNLSIDFWRTDYSGFVSVSVDDIVYKQINLYAHRSQYTDFNGTLQTYPIADGLDPGTHIAKVEVMGTHSSSSSPIHNNNNSVIVDGFRPGVIYINETYTTSTINYTADNNFAETPDIVLEHALVLKAYNGGYTYTATPLQVAQGTIYLPLIHTPETYSTSIESITIDTAPVDLIELMLIDANISFETNYPYLWNSSIIPDLETSGIIVSVFGNNVTIHSNNTTRLMMPVIIATIGGGSGETGPLVDTTPPIIWFTTSPPRPPTTIYNTQPLITARYFDPSGIDVNSVKVYLDGVSVNASDVDATETQVNYTPSTPFEPGWHNITVKVSDAFGNTGNMTSGNFFVIPPIAPLITIISPTNTSQSNVSRGYNVTVNFTYTDTNAKTYIVNINNSTTTIATVTNNVATNGTNISVSVNLTIPSNTALGLYDVWVWMNDTSGLSNSSLEFGAVNVTMAQAEHLVLNASTAVYKDKEIEMFKISNNGTSDIVINQIIVSWIPNSSQKIEEVKIKDPDPDSKWEVGVNYVPSVSSPSGTTLTLNNPLTMHISDSHNMDFYFDTDMTGKTFNVTFLLGDGSSKTVVFTP